ncbi:MAG: LytTR family DNA-binding domain-containing protein [Bacteroidota bacterium]
MRTLIIDNETAVRNLLKKFLEMFCPEVEVIGEAHGVASGIEAIKKYDPQLVFLDVLMDDGTGLDLLRKVRQRDFEVIFITAHGEYAVDAFKFSALDYLLKPVDPEDLINAVEKAKKTIEKENLNLKLAVLFSNVEAFSNTNKKIILKDANSIHIVGVSEIMHCKAEGSYTRFFLSDGRELFISRNLKEYEDMLQPFGFYRPHHSYLVNIHQVLRYDKTDGGLIVMRDKTILPVSTRKRDRLIELLNMI